MVKRKRSDSDIVERVLKKVKKLVKVRKRIVSSSSSSDDDPSENEQRELQTPPGSPVHSHDQDLDREEAQGSDREISDEIPNEAPEIDGEELDPEILQLLGSDPSQDKAFGEKLHKDLAPRWKHILSNGLPKEEKIDLLKQYLPPENCAYMKAPALNPEIKSAISDINAKKDSYSEQKQNQMASCISAVGNTLNLALAQKDVIPQEIIKMLSDAGRLLCDTHYRESLSRRYSIINAISRQKREVIKNTKIDDHLFGSNLSEHLKSNKAISASASELKFNSGKFKNTANNSGALNARGAPRAPAADQRVYPYQNQPRRQPPPPSAPRDYRRAPPQPANQRSRSYPQPARKR